MTEKSLAKVPTVDLRHYTDSSAEVRRSFVRTLGEGLKRFGFLILEGHGVDQVFLDGAYGLFRRFFALDAPAKTRYSGVVAGARGYTPFGVEHAKDSDKPDLKEFWQVGRELPEGHPYRGEYPENVWPDEVPGFREAALELFRRLEECSATLLRALADYFELPRETFAAMIEDGNHVLRILHYPPVPVGVDAGSLRAAPHEDINLITLLCNATDSGLEILLRDGRWLAVEPRADQIVVDAGDMLARVVNDVIPATTHRVVNPPASANRSRYSLPFFAHPYSACDLTVMDAFISPASPPKYAAITAGEFLEERLREIGLKE